MKTTETILIIARRPAGSTFSVSLNDGDGCGRTLEERRASFERSAKSDGITIVGVQRIVTELPPKKRKVRDHTVVVTVKSRAQEGRILTFSRSDEELKEAGYEAITARQWADEEWGAEATRNKGFQQLHRTEFYAEYEVEEE